jgi:hypothetical protein
MRLKRALLRATAALVAIVGIGAATVAVQSPAFAATCSGSGCTGKDPQTTGCSAKVTTPASKTSGSPSQMFTLQLRYSTICNTYWARGVRGDCLAPVIGTPYLAIREWVYSQQHWLLNRVYYKRITAYCDGGTNWTLQIYRGAGGRSYEACHGAAFGSTDPSTITNWYCI